MVPLWRSVVLFGLGAAAVLGCQRDPLAVGRLAPVEGQITVKGLPLDLGQAAFGRVWFYPDAAKGNTCPQVPVGDIDGDGRYKLWTRGQPGAPAGWYKVMVVATEQIDPSRPSRKRKSFVHRKYGAVETSGLTVQVLDSAEAGAYDLTLSR